jgi:hypothetical protein
MVFIKGQEATTLYFNFLSAAEMASPQDHVKRKAVETTGSVTPTDSVYLHERRDVESGASKNEFGELDEKYAQFHEIGLSPQNSSLEGASEDLTKSQKRSLLYAKYKIFFHVFLWLLFTG